MRALSGISRLRSKKGSCVSDTDPQLSHVTALWRMPENRTTMIWSENMRERKGLNEQGGKWREKKSNRWERKEDVNKSHVHNLDHHHTLKEVADGTITGRSEGRWRPRRWQWRSGGGKRRWRSGSTRRGLRLIMINKERNHQRNKRKKRK